MPTPPPPLAGSQFQGGDGDQDDATGLIDWQGLQANGRVGHTSDPNAHDDIFTGSKELNPDGWELTTQNGGASPGSANVLDTYRAFDHPVGSDAFLYLAFTREASNGTIFVTSELNQDPRTWTNSQGTTIPCRTTGDLLITFGQQGNVPEVHVQRWVTDPPSSGCAKQGRLQDARLTSNIVQASFNNGSTAINNSLPGFYGTTIEQLKFGEAAVNLAKALSDLGDPCAVFGSTWMHSRSSLENTSDMKDYLGPEPFHLRTCKASPALSSTASGKVNRRARGRHRLRRHRVLARSMSIYDTATLSDGDNPTGTLTFNLYGPGDADCSGTPVFASAAAVKGNGSYQSGSFTPTAVGTYRWVVSYSGDDNNNPVGPTTCELDTETVTIARANPSLSSTASGPLERRRSARGRRRAARRHLARATQPIHDTATLDGGIAPTGTMTFKLYGPNNGDCSGDPIFASPVPVKGNGSYTSVPFTPTAAGTYRWRVTYSGDANNNGAGPTACGIPEETTVINPARPKIVTDASDGAQVGDRVTDSATLTDGADPTGTITFKVYSPGDANCDGPAADTSTVDVSGNDTYTSDPFTADEQGTYRWVARYSGDKFNEPAATSCGDLGESSLVGPPSPVQPQLATTASASAPAGSPIHDTAHLSDGDAPTGTITFKVYGPNNAACDDPPASQSSVKVDSGNGDYTSEPFTSTAAGTYTWVASYSGDERNKPAGPTACSDATETVVVSKAHPALSTVTPPAVGLGRSVGDTATLSGSEPTGTITFNLYGPDDATCSGTPAFTAGVTVTGNGVYRSPRFSPVSTGSYRWVAAYSGDANNETAATGCGDKGETVVVLPRRPRLTTSASPLANLRTGRRVRAAGLPIYDAAILRRGFAPTGQITFTLFAPDDPTCAGTPVFTTATNVDGNGVYNSERFTPTAAGTYRWIATYSGDANNRPAGPTDCGDPAEQVRVTLPAAPELTTSASPAVTLGAAIHDTAHLSDGSAPTGTITFRLYAPADDDCSGRLIFTSTVQVSGNGDYVSGSHVPTAAGAYRWVAEYSGDTHHEGAGPTPCGSEPEIAVIRSPDITPVTPEFATTASASPGVGAPVYDTAHLSGAVAPFGSITFALFGPEDATCSGPPVFTTTSAVRGNGDYRSDPFVAPRAGTYRWVAEYSGDALNAGSGPGTCNETAETIVVSATGVAGGEVGPNVPTPSKPRPKRKPHPPGVSPIVTG